MSEVPPPPPRPPAYSDPAQASPAPQPAKRARTVWKPALLGGLAGLVVLALLIGGILFFRGRAATGLTRPPQAAGAVDTSAVADYRLRALPADFVPPDDSADYLLMAGKSADALVMTMQGHSTPQWIAPIPRTAGEGAPACTASGSVLTCGATRVDLATGDASPAKSAGEAAPGSAAPSPGAGSSPVAGHTPGTVKVDDITIRLDGDSVIGTGADGKEAWRVTVKGAKSFTVQGHRLFVQAGDAVYVFDFSKRGKAADVTPSATAQPSKRLGRADFANGALALPAWCDDYVSAPTDSTSGTKAKTGFATVTFKNGRYHPKGASVPYQGAQIAQVVPMSVAGSPAAAVRFTCNGGGNYSYDSVAVYGADKSPLGSVEFAGADEGTLMGSAPKLYVTMAATGDYLTLNVPVGVYGDDDCTGCGRSGKGTYTYRVSGGKLKIRDAVLRARGREVRMPAMRDVQKLLDAVRTGDDEYAAKHATADQMKALNNQVGDGEDPKNTERRVQFGPGVRADTCEVVRPVGHGDDFMSSYYFGNGNTTGTLGAFDDDGNSQLRTGDIICGVVSNDVPMQKGEYGSKFYALYILLRGNPTGDVQAYYFGRQFS